MKFKEGDYVKVTAREQTPADIKSGFFYPHFCGMAGVVDKIYDEEVCLKIDLDTLPGELRKRHIEIQESMKRKWLNGLSGEARNRLTSEEKRFELAYTILVQAADIEKTKQPAPKPVEVKSAKPVEKETKEEQIKALTERDLDDAEEAYLKQKEAEKKN